MNSTATSVTRSVAILLTIAFIVSSVPLVISDESVVDVASAQTGGIVNVGWIGEFMNWNPLTVEMVSDWVAYNLIFSTMFQYDEDWDQIHNHLATGYYQVEWPAGNMSTYINITENAYFRNADNPTDTTRPLTAEDVKFTFDLIQANPGNSWDYYLYDVTGTYVINDHQVKIDTEYTKATLIDDLVWVPILPKFQWEVFLAEGGTILGSMKPDELIGSGAFCYDDGAKNDWHDFITAPNFHATSDYEEDRDIDYEGIRFQIYSDINGLVFGINSGELDVVDVSGAQQTAWEAIGGGASSMSITKQVTQELGIYDIAINAIPLELREAIDYGHSGNEILLDRTVRQAIGMTLNKAKLAEVDFYGLADEADTVLNPGFWHADLSNPLSYDPAAAKQLLIDAGYVDTDGDEYLEVTADSLAYENEWAEIGDKLEFRLQVPSSDPAYTTIGLPWVSEAKEAGIKFNFEALPTGPITNQQWYMCEYDLWVWSWYWGPEPLSNLACWLTAQVREGGYNCVGPICQGGLNDEEDGWWWVNEEEGVARCGFDDTFDLALRATDVNDRKVYVDELQEKIYETYTEFPPLHPVGLYAFNTDRYEGWGNWTEHVARTIISDMLWIWYDLEPIVDNALPRFETSPSSVYDPLVNTPCTFSVSISDPEGDAITVNWSAGDGTTHSQTEDGDTKVPRVIEWTHTYDTVDTFNFRIALSDEHHEYPAATVATATVIVVEEINDAPTVEGLTKTPERAYVGDETTWSVSASDHEQGVDGEGLLFTWDWGDGTYTTTPYQPVDNDTLVEDEQTHTWDSEGIKYVCVWVWDGYGDEDDPIHNVSVEEPGGYEVFVNMPPTAPMATNISGLEGKLASCEAVASDPDPDTLSFTWDWGDDTFNVTEATPTVLGEEVSSTVKYEWATAGTYPVEIWVDDGEGHNVSTTIHAIILPEGEEAPPGSISVTLSPSPGTVDVPVTLTVGASDPNEDALTNTIDFGDDSDLAVDHTAGGTADMQYAEFSHTYSEQGVYEVTVYVDDSTHNVSTTRDILIVINGPPEVALASSYTFYYNQSKEVRPASIGDPEGDPLTVWYDWGDDSPMSLGDSDDGFAASHAYNETGDFVLEVFVDDGRGNNVSATAAVNVQEGNRRPDLVNIAKSDPAGEKYIPGEMIYLNVTVRDEEGDPLEVTVDFGDGSPPSTIELDPEALVNETVGFTHAYEEGRATPYTVTVSVKDDKDHPDMSLVSQEMLITVEEEGDDGISTLLVLLVGLIVVAALAAAAILMRRKGGGEKPSAEGGDMEGMAPSEMTEEKTGAGGGDSAPMDEEPPIA